MVERRDRGRDVSWIGVGRGSGIWEGVDGCLECRITEVYSCLGVEVFVRIGGRMVNFLR